jgi:DNA (cytosine-5)-methyltransferase 1
MTDSDRPVSPAVSRLLDLFCGAGGAAMGYHRAGFQVVGVDINPQPHYPFEFHQADAMTYPLDGFDAIHASPPCQAYTSMRRLGKGAGDKAPDLVAATRERLLSAGVPYVIENVPGAPLLSPVVLCGSMFDLQVRRHRLFESNMLLFRLPCAHQPGGLAVYGDHPENSPIHRRSMAVYGKRPGDRLPNNVWRAPTLEAGQEAMGIDWMPWRSLTQAIPPAYTEHLGRQLLRAVEAVA